MSSGGELLRRGVFLPTSDVVEARVPETVKHATLRVARGGLGRRNGWDPWASIELT